LKIYQERLQNRNILQLFSKDYVPSEVGLCLQLSIYRMTHTSTPEQCGNREPNKKALLFTNYYYHLPLGLSTLHMGPVKKSCTR